MQIMKKILALSSLFLVGGLSFTPVQAEELKINAERCELGSTCGIPGNDNGITYFNITPQIGTSYQCHVKADQGQNLTIWVHGGKEYTINNGGGLYHAEPEVVINIDGRFDNPNNPQAIGQIKFTKLIGGQGQVTCNKLG